MSLSLMPSLSTAQAAGQSMESYVRHVTAATTALESLPGGGVYWPSGTSASALALSVGASAGAKYVPSLMDDVRTVFSHSGFGAAGPAGASDTAGTEQMVYAVPFGVEQDEPPLPLPAVSDSASGASVAPDVAAGVVVAEVRKAVEEAIAAARQVGCLPNPVGDGDENDGEQEPEDDSDEFALEGDADEDDDDDHDSDDDYGDDRVVPARNRRVARRQRSGGRSKNPLAAVPTDGKMKKRNKKRDLRLHPNPTRRVASAPQMKLVLEVFEQRNKPSNEELAELLVLINQYEPKRTLKQVRKMFDNLRLRRRAAGCTSMDE